MASRTWIEEIDSSGNIVQRDGILVDINENDSGEIVMMKVNQALSGKDFIETEYSKSGQKRIK